MRRPGQSTFHTCFIPQMVVADELPNSAGGAANESPSATCPDWSRERCRRGWDPPRRLLACIRHYQACRKRNTLLAALISKWCVLRHIFWSAVTGADIPLNAQIEGGLLLLHPNGIVVHPGARIGPNCLLLQQVTLCGGVVLEGNVMVGAGAKIIAPVVVGANAKIGANSVVLQDVPRNATAVGIPARTVTK